MKTTFKEFIDNSYLIITTYRKAVAAIIILFVVALVIVGYSFPWTGLGDFTKPSSDFIRGKTLWDWMQLLIIPLILSFGVFYLNHAERESERQIATDRQNEAALQSYIDKMADLLLRENLRESRNQEARNIARARTLTVLRVIDGGPRNPKIELRDRIRKGIVIEFLFESGLVDQEPIVNLTGAYLEAIHLSRANLAGVNLAKTYLWSAVLVAANLAGANLSEARLDNSNLASANLEGAIMNGVHLDKADLEEANLSEAKLITASLWQAELSRAVLVRADLTDASLAEARLVNADLSGARLIQADLHEADLSGANLTGADLSGAFMKDAKLVGTTMPDGTKHQ